MNTLKQSYIFRVAVFMFIMFLLISIACGNATPKKASETKPKKTIEATKISVPAQQPESKPTETPVPTNTPIPTNTPVPELSFTDIVQHPEEKGWTSTQYSTYFETIKGKQVSGSGAILEIKEYGGEPYLSLDMKPGEPKIDAYVYINKGDVLKVGLRQNVTFAGTIDSNWAEPNGFFALQVKKVTLLKLGEIPPTPTPGPTNTPTPDIGSEITAEIMCKDFVKKNLKSPSTADFGGLFDDRDKAAFVNPTKAKEAGIDTTKLHNSGVWVVVGQVDAQNAFGTMIRSEYTCVMDYDKNTQMWYLLDISIK